MDFKGKILEVSSLQAYKVFFRQGILPQAFIRRIYG